MLNKFRHPVNTKRRLITFPDETNWNTMLNYWAITIPFPDYDEEHSNPDNYPGEPMPDTAYQKMLTFAQKFLGYPYLWGGKAPPAFDCSGFVGYVYKQCLLIPEEIISYTETLKAYCTKVDYPKYPIFPGDLVFWTMTEQYQAHVGIYIGNGYVLDCSGSGVDYRLISSHRHSNFDGYYRVPPMP